MQKMGQHPNSHYQRRKHRVLHIPAWNQGKGKCHAGILCWRLVSLIVAGTVHVPSAAAPRALVLGHVMPFLHMHGACHRPLIPAEWWQQEDAGNAPATALPTPTWWPAPPRPTRSPGQLSPQTCLPVAFPGQLPNLGPNGGAKRQPSNQVENSSPSNTIPESVLTPTGRCTSYGHTQTSLYMGQAPSPFRINGEMWNRNLPLASTPPLPSHLPLQDHWQWRGSHGGDRHGMWGGGSNQCPCLREGSSKQGVAMAKVEGCSSTYGTGSSSRPWGSWCQVLLASSTN